jgi:hypothetical protein
MPSRIRRKRTEGTLSEQRRRPRAGVTGTYQSKLPDGSPAPCVTSRRPYGNPCAGVLDRALADEQLSGDLPVGESRPSEPKDLGFLGRELIQRICRSPAGAFPLTTRLPSRTEVVDVPTHGVERDHGRDMTDLTGRRRETEGFSVSHVRERRGLQRPHSAGLRQQGRVGRGPGRSACRPLPQDGPDAAGQALTP